MKISKILAGLSAAAMAASMLSMVVSADDAAGTAAATSTVIAEGSFKYEKEATAAAWGVDSGVSVSLKDDITAFEDLDDYSSIQVTAEISNATGTEADKFGLSFYDMGSSNWSWNVPGQAQFEGGKLEFTFAPSAVNPKGDEEVGDIGIQVFIDGAEEGKTYTADVKYTVTGVTGGATEDDNPYANITYTEKAEATADAYAGDWGGTAYTPEGWDISNIKAADGIKVTYTYTLEDGFDYYLAAPFDGHGWAKLYNEKYEPESGTIYGVPLKSAYTAEELEAEKNVVLQNDGYFIFKEPGTLTFYITEKGINNLLANAKDNPSVDSETGAESIWYQLGAQVYGVNITSAVYEWNNNEEVVDNSSSEESSESTSESAADSSAVDSKATDSSSKAASTAASTNPGTGAAALAAVGVALAGAAVVTSKKRK